MPSKRLEPVLSLDEWYKKNYPNESKFATMGRYREWLDYRTKVLEKNRAIREERNKLNKKNNA